MDQRSTAAFDFRQNNNNNDNDDDEVGGQIEGYNGPSSSSSSSTQGTSSKSRHQRKDGDDQLDEDDFERILSRSTACRLLSLFEGTPQVHIIAQLVQVRAVFESWNFVKALQETVQVQQCDKLRIAESQSK